MKTKDKKFTGRVDEFETDFKTSEYKIVVCGGLGNISGTLVYSACIKSTSNHVIEKSSEFYTSFQEAKISMNPSMLLSQRNIDEHTFAS